MICLYSYKFDDKFFKSLEKLPLELRKRFYKKIDYIKFLSEESSRKHLEYDLPYFSEKVSKSARLVYNIKDNTIYFFRCFKTHKEYERWYKSIK